MATDRLLGELFEQLANPDKNGVSDWIDVKNLPKGFEKLKVTNGSSWSRQKSYLAKKYNLKKRYRECRGRPLLYVKLDGFKND